MSKLLGGEGKVTGTAEKDEALIHARHLLRRTISPQQIARTFYYGVALSEYSRADLLRIVVAEARRAWALAKQRRADEAFLKGRGL